MNYMNLYDKKDRFTKYLEANTILGFDRENFVQQAMNEWPEITLNADDINQKLEEADVDGYVPMPTIEGEKRQQRRELSRKLRQNLVGSLGDSLYSELPNDPKGLRYPQQLMMKTGNPALVQEENQKIYDHIIQPQGHMAEVIRYHYDVLKKLENMHPEKLAFEKMSDEQIVENWEQIGFASTVLMQFQNFKEYFENYHIQPVDDESRRQWEEIRQMMETMEPYGNAINAKNIRLGTIANPYYEVLDLDDPATDKYINFVVANTKTVARNMDEWNPSGRRDDIDKLSQYLSDANVEKVSYAMGEVFAAQRLLQEKGVNPENIYVRIVGEENRAKKLDTNSVMSPVYKLAGDPDARVEVYDVEHPEVKFSVFGAGDKQALHKMEDGVTHSEMPEAPNYWKQFWHFVSGGYFYKQDYADYDRALAQNANQGVVDEVKGVRQGGNKAPAEKNEEKVKDPAAQRREHHAEVAANHMAQLLQPVRTADLDKMTKFINESREILSQPGMEKVCDLVATCGKDTAVVLQDISFRNCDLNKTFQNIKSLATEKNLKTFSASRIIDAAIENQEDYQTQLNQAQNGFFK